MITIISRARYGYAEVVSHTGADACKVGGEDYTDNSRTSVVCKEHRDEYRRQMSKQRSKQRIRKEAER